MFCMSRFEKLHEYCGERVLREAFSSVFKSFKELLKKFRVSGLFLEQWVFACKGENFFDSRRVFELKVKRGIVLLREHKDELCKSRSANEISAEPGDERKEGETRHFKKANAFISGDFVQDVFNDFGVRARLAYHQFLTARTGGCFVCEKGDGVDRLKKVLAGCLNRSWSGGRWEGNSFLFFLVRAQLNKAVEFSGDKFFEYLK